MVKKNVVAEIEQFFEMHGCEVCLELSSVGLFAWVTNQYEEIVAEGWGKNDQEVAYVAARENFNQELWRRVMWVEHADRRKKL